MKHLALIAAISLACPAAAHAKATQALPQRETLLPRITAVDARYAANQLFGNYAAGLGARLVITPCKPAGRRSRHCIVRIGHDRYLATSCYANSAREPLAAARRLR